MADAECEDRGKERGQKRGRGERKKIENGAFNRFGSPSDEPFPRKSNNWRRLAVARQATASSAPPLRSNRAGKRAENQRQRTFRLSQIGLSSLFPAPSPPSRFSIIATVAFLDQWRPLCATDPAVEAVTTAVLPSKRLALGQDGTAVAQRTERTLRGRSGRASVRRLFIAALSDGGKRRWKENTHAHTQRGMGCRASGGDRFAKARTSHTSPGSTGTSALRDVYGRSKRKKVELCSAAVLQ